MLTTGTPQNDSVSNMISFVCVRVEKVRTKVKVNH